MRARPMGPCFAGPPQCRVELELEALVELARRVPWRA